MLDCWPTRREKAEELAAALKYFSENKQSLPGVESDKARQTLALQMVASLRRIDYTNIILTRHIHPDRANPGSPLFDPKRAAVFHDRSGDFDEAVWLVFLATHFGKHPEWGWRRLRDVYSGLGMGVWTWDRVSKNPEGFRNWLRENRYKIGGAFGNHRKYESLNTDYSTGTACVVKSYVNWIGPHRSHKIHFNSLVQAGGNDPHSIFDQFYNDMEVGRFGRLGKFDYLTLLGRLDLAPISPGSAYLESATGPVRGARLLFTGSPDGRVRTRTLDKRLRELDAELNVGMQVMEDSLCNWQKCPQDFIHFRA